MPPNNAQNMADLVLNTSSKLWIMLMIVNLDDYIKNTNGITVSVLQCSANKNSCMRVGRIIVFVGLTHTLLAVPKS